MSLTCVFTVPHVHCPSQMGSLSWQCADIFSTLDLVQVRRMPERIPMVDEVEEETEEELEVESRSHIFLFEKLSLKTESGERSPLSTVGSLRPHRSQSLSLLVSLSHLAIPSSSTALMTSQRRRKRRRRRSLKGRRSRWHSKDSFSQKVLGGSANLEKWTSWYSSSLQTSSLLLRHSSALELPLKSSPPPLWFEQIRHLEKHLHVKK